MSRYNLSAVVSGASVLCGITQDSLPMGAKIEALATTGEPYARTISVQELQRRAQFTTLDVLAALNIAASLGASIDDMSGGLVLHAVKRAHGATRAAGSVHRSFTYAKGLLVPRRLSAAHAGDATIQYEVLPTSTDGATDVVVISDVAATPTLAAAERYTLGAVSVGGVTITGHNSVDVDFGIKAEPEGAEGNLFPTHCSIDEVLPKVTLKTVDINLLTAAGIPLTGKTCTQANTTLAFRKRSGASLTTGFTLAVAGYAHFEEALSASGSKTGEANLVIEVKFDGTNSPITVS